MAPKKEEPPTSKNTKNAPKREKESTTNKLENRHPTSTSIQRYSKEQQNNSCVFEVTENEVLFNSSNNKKLNVKLSPTETLISPSKYHGKREEGWKEVVRKSSVQQNTGNGTLLPTTEVKKVQVPTHAISRVIGRAGSNINAIRAATGAHIEVEKQGKVQNDRSITIKGSIEATKQAQLLINTLVRDPEVDILHVLAKEGIGKVSITSNSSHILIGTWDKNKQPSSSTTSSQDGDVAPVKHVNKKRVNANGTIGNSATKTRPIAVKNVQFVDSNKISPTKVTTVSVTQSTSVNSGRLGLKTSLATNPNNPLALSSINIMASSCNNNSKNAASIDIPNVSVVVNQSQQTTNKTTNSVSILQPKLSTQQQNTFAARVSAAVTISNTSAANKFQENLSKANKSPVVPSNNIFRPVPTKSELSVDICPDDYQAKGVIHKHQQLTSPKEQRLLVSHISSKVPLSPQANSQPITSKPFQLSSQIIRSKSNLSADKCATDLHIISATHNEYSLFNDSYGSQWDNKQYIASVAAAANHKIERTDFMVDVSKAPGYRGNCSSSPVSSTFNTLISATSKCFYPKNSSSTSDQNCHPVNPTSAFDSDTSPSHQPTVSSQNYSSPTEKQQYRTDEQTPIVVTVEKIGPNQPLSTAVVTDQLLVQRPGSIIHPVSSTVSHPDLPTSSYVSGLQLRECHQVQDPFTTANFYVSPAHSDFTLQSSVNSNHPIPSRLNPKALSFSSGSAASVQQAACPSVTAICQKTNSNQFSSTVNIKQQQQQHQHQHQHQQHQQQQYRIYNTDQSGPQINILKNIMQPNGQADFKNYISSSSTSTPSLDQRVITNSSSVNAMTWYPEIVAGSPFTTINFEGGSVSNSGHLSVGGINSVSGISPPPDQQQTNNSMIGVHGDVDARKIPRPIGTERSWKFSSASATVGSNYVNASIGRPIENALSTNNMLLGAACWPIDNIIPAQPQITSKSPQQQSLPLAWMQATSGAVGAPQQRTPYDDIVIAHPDHIQVS